MSALDNAIALLRRVAVHLEDDRNDSRSRAIHAMISEFLESPDAPPSELGAMLDEVHALHVEDGRLDALAMENDRRIHELWQRIEATKGGAE